MKNKKLLSLLALGCLCCGALASCGESAAPEANLTASYIYSELVDNSYSDYDYNVYELFIYDDNSYAYTSTSLIHGYGMNLGTTVITNYGSYTVGASSDGYTAYTLSDADHCIFNSYSLAGGYNISIDSETATYPVELLASGEGEKVYAQSKEEVISAYGSSITVYIQDGSNIFYFENPAA